MGRGRGKAKKQNLVAAHDDAGSGEEEKIPVYKKRGRPQKPLKDDMEEEEAEKLDESNGEIAKSSFTNKDVKNQVATENGKKRKRSSQSKENPVKEENGSLTKAKTVGYRQIGSRRKSKPRRAAEAGVECHQFLD